jgi:hypothetical protein
MRRGERAAAGQSLFSATNSILLDQLLSIFDQRRGIFLRME